MNPLSRHLATMAYNNAWSNHRLLGAVARLSPDEFRATRTSFFPSLKATLNHNVTVDWYYVDALERGLRGDPPNAEADEASTPALCGLAGVEVSARSDNRAARFFEPREPFEDAALLQRAQREVDLRLVEACVGLTDDRANVRIGIVRRTGIVEESATRLLAHLFQHQIHHRGQAHAMLAGTGEKPPQLDEFFCKGEAELRASELAELGFRKR